MRGVQLPDAPLLRDAVLGNEDAIGAPAPAEDGGSNNIISSGAGEQLGGVRGVQEEEVGEGVPLHGV